MPYHFVRARAPGHWPVFGTTHLVRALVKAVWSIDQKSTVVEPGLVVGFASESDAQYFINAHIPAEPTIKEPEEPRAAPVMVEEGSIVCFADEKLAAFACEKGLADPMSEQDVMEAVERAHGAVQDEVADEATGAAEETDVHKPAMENKAQAAPPATKTAPAPAKKGGKAKK